MARTIDSAETAKLMRKQFKANFSGTKFSVRTRRYAGGSSIDVTWTDGPTVDQVEQICSLYRNASFDGMTDSYNYWTSLVADESGEVEEVRFAPKFIFTRREISDDFIAHLCEELPELRGTHRENGGFAHCPGCGKTIFDGTDCWLPSSETGHHWQPCCSHWCAARKTATVRSCDLVS